MHKNEKLIGMLNDLIRINNDRFEGYKNLLAEKNVIDNDIRLLVFNMADQSRANTSALITEVIKLRTADVTGASFSASIYRPNMGLKKSVSTGDRHSILESCKMREEIIQKAYYDALSLAAEIPDAILNLISDQKREMKSVNNMINIYRLSLIHI